MWASPKKGNKTDVTGYREFAEIHAVGPEITERDMLKTMVAIYSKILNRIDDDSKTGTLNVGTIQKMDTDIGFILEHLAFLKKDNTDFRAVSALFESLHNEVRGLYPPHPEPY